MRRLTEANGTCTMVVPLETAKVVMAAPAVGFPSVKEYGPMVCNALIEALPGKAAARAVMPAGVGVSEVPLDDVLPAERIRSPCPETKNQLLSCHMGPPTVPPKRFST